MGSFGKKENRRGYLELFVCGLIGAAVFLLLYGTDTLRVTNDKWILNGYVEEDIIQHYTGWMAFRDSAWSFPLGLAGNLGYPEGTVISFTDSLPLVSLFFKCISGLLPETFQFFGWYTLCCFVLQGISSGLLVRLFTKNCWGIYGSSLLFVCSPLLIERAFRHTALASQWLVLFALYLYFRARKRGLLPWGFLALQVLCVGLHPYFVPMVCGILAAWTLEGMLPGVGWRTGSGTETAGRTACGIFFLGNLLTIGVTGYVLGLFGSGVSGSAGGFGYYSMNLNALWNPVSLGVEKWSQILPVLPQTGGNYDGFNYLGFGVLVFGTAGFLGRTGALLRKKRLGTFCKSYLGLILFCGFCTLFALSHVITLGSKEILVLPLPESLLRLCSVFRASGRLFWPVYELLFLVACLTAVRLPEVLKSHGGIGKKERPYGSGIRKGKRQLLPAALVILVVLQLYDLKPALAWKHGSVDAGNPGTGSYDPKFYQSEDWQQVLTAYERAELLNYHHDYNLAAFLMKHHQKSNILPANRGDFAAAQERCREMILELYRGGEMEERVLYLTNDPLLAQQLKWNLPKNVAAYDLGEYTGFGRVLPEVTARRAAAEGEPGAFAVIAPDSPDWNYLRQTKENELLFPSTAVLEWELSRAEGLMLGQERMEITGVEKYSNEYIRDYVYVQCPEGVDLTVWRQAESIRIVRGKEACGTE